MANENIKLIKQFLTNQDANNTIDRSFNELISKRNRVTIPEFFDYYNNLFYDIPRLGALSHQELANKSIEYIGNYQDPRDLEIRNLNFQIEELTQRVNELEFEEIQNEIANATTKVIIDVKLLESEWPKYESSMYHKDVETHQLVFKDGINDKYLKGSFHHYRNETIEILTQAKVFTLFYDGRNKTTHKDDGVAWRTFEEKIYEIPEGDNVYPVDLHLPGERAYNMSYTGWMQEKVDIATEEAAAAQEAQEATDSDDEGGN